MSQYYAAYACNADQVAIFATLQLRDAWVDYQDDLSRGECNGFIRMALTEAQARALMGDRLDDPSLYVPDDFIDGILWCVAEGCGPYWEYDGETRPDLIRALSLAFDVF